MKSINKKMIALGAMVLVLIGGSFYGGMAYARSQRPPIGAFRNAQGGAQGGQFARGGTSRGGAMGAFVTGEVLSKDPAGISIKLPNGNSEIVLAATSTAVMKAVEATLDDVVVGANVVVQGSQNSDGSVTAQSIQLRPEGAPILGSGANRR